MMIMIHIEKSPVIQPEHLMVTRIYSTFWPINGPYDTEQSTWSYEENWGDLG